MILNNNIQKIVNAVSDEMGIPKNTGTIIYRNYWLFIKNTIEQLPDLYLINEEEFNKLKVNFNIPELGKFTTNINKIIKTNKFKDLVNEKIKHIKM